MKILLLVINETAKQMFLKEYRKVSCTNYMRTKVKFFLLMAIWPLSVS